jgi:hypothetical protein
MLHDAHHQVVIIASKDAPLCPFFRQYNGNRIAKLSVMDMAPGDVMTLMEHDAHHQVVIIASEDAPLCPFFRQYNGNRIAKLSFPVAGYGRLAGALRNAYPGIRKGGRAP